MALEPFFTPKDLAKRWGISTKTLANWRWEGKGPDFFKLEGKPRYNKKRIERYERDAGNTARD